MPVNKIRELARLRSKALGVEITKQRILQGISLRELQDRLIDGSSATFYRVVDGSCNLDSFLAICEALELDVELKPRKK